eukprot:GHVP01042068.1.p1 GENE.GHVP01042068.1~~GHVP01042068.1.p1  ORF type:complete len:253 (-),score=35.29 GHVP01042068.1:205-963(-)
MEFTTLSDQLNSACEEYFGLSQANGFPLQDDLYQGNSIEPEFRRFFFHKSSYKNKLKLKDVKHRLKDLFFNLQRFSQQQVYTFRHNKEEVKSDFHKTLETIHKDLKYGEDEESCVHIQPCFNGEGRRLWTFRICNCNLRKEELRKFVLRECKSTSCHTFSVTWDPVWTVDEAGCETTARSIAKNLWVTLEWILDCHNKYVNDWDKREEEFEKVWEKIRQSKNKPFIVSDASCIFYESDSPDSEEFLSEEDED